MKNTIMKTLAVSTITTVLSLTMLPFVATPVFAESGLTCTVKTNSDGTTYTECVEYGQSSETEVINQMATEAQQTWEQETGYTYGVNINDQQVATVHTCQDDGYSADYYWSESAQACVTDYVAPTPVATTVPTPTPVPTATPTATSTPAQAPVEPTVSTPNTETVSTWNYLEVANVLLAKINEQRIAFGFSPLTVMEVATADATQRANESMEFAKSTTAYGTTTDRHVGFDTEIGDTEVNSYVSQLNGSETTDEVADLIYSNLTTGITSSNAPFSAEYQNVGVGFADAHFTSRYGTDKGYNIWFNLQLVK